MKALLRWIFSDVFPKNPLPLSKRFCSLPLYAPSAMRCSRATCAGYIARDTWALQHNPPFKHISINDGQIDELLPLEELLNQLWHHEFHLRSIWLNIILKIFVQHIYFNHTTPMKQSLKTLSLEDLRFPTKCAPRKALFSPKSWSSPCSIYFLIRYGHSLVYSLFDQTSKYPQHLPHWIIFENFISRRFQIPKRGPPVMKIICPGQLLLTLFTIEGEWVIQHQTQNLMIIGTHPFSYSCVFSCIFEFPRPKYDTPPTTKVSCPFKHYE